MRVPTYDNLTTTPSTTPDAMYSQASGPNAEQIVGQQTQELGNATQKAADMSARIQINAQQMIDQVRVNDAVNKARQAAQDLAYNPNNGYLNLKGDAALTRPNGQDLPSEYGEKLQTSLSGLAGTLSTDEQRRQFSLSSQELQTQFHGQVQSHMLGEFQSHVLSVQDGTINLASDDAKRNWSDPDRITPSLDAAKAAVWQKGQVSGWSANQTAAAMLTTTSKVHSEVVTSALENNNPNYALTYFDKNKGEMTADDILRMQGHVNHQVWAGQAQSAVQVATSKAMPAVAPTDFDRMTNITLQSESGGRRYATDGSLLTSPAGAKGEMQVMPGTSTAPGFGVKPAQDNSPQELARVGRDYLHAMLQRYGDPAKAWAAYNAGPGAVDKALKVAGSGAQGTSSDWLSQMPEETQKYVTQNVASLQASGGQPPKPTELEFVNNALSALPPGSPPDVVKMTRDQATAQFGIITKTMTETGNNAVSEAQRWLASNGGQYSMMPASLRDSVTRFAPDKADDLLKYAEHFAKPVESKTDLVLYNRLESHPEEMVKMTDPQFESLRPYLSIADFKYFSKQRQHALNDTTEDSAQGINSAAVKAALTPRLESLGISTTPGTKDTAGRERLGGVQQFVRESIFSAQQQEGKKFTPAEVEKHIDSLFSKSVTFRNSLWGGTSSQPLMQLQIGDLPSGAADGLRNSLIASGNKAPTNTDILNLYRRVHVKQ